MKSQYAKNPESSLAAKLEEILEGIGWLSSVEVISNPADYDRAFDLQAVIGVPRGKRIELWVECKDMRKPSRFPYVNLENRFRKDGTKSIRVPALAAPYIFPPEDRMKPKDPFDVWYVVKRHPGGIDALIEAFRPHLDHGLVKLGLGILARKFERYDSWAPTQVGGFDSALSGAEQEGRQRYAYERIGYLLTGLGFETP